MIWISGFHSLHVVEVASITTIACTTVSNANYSNVHLNQIYFIDDKTEPRYIEIEEFNSEVVDEEISNANNPFESNTMFPPIAEIDDLTPNWPSYQSFFPFGHLLCATVLQIRCSLL